MADKPKASELSIASTVYRGKRLGEMTRDELVAAFVENDRQYKEKLDDLQGIIDVLVGAERTSI